MMKAIVLIKLETGEHKAALRDLKRIKSIQKVNLAFGPYDAIAMIESDDLNHIGRIVEFEIQTIPEVLKTLTCLMIEADLPIPVPQLDQPAEEEDEYLYERSRKRVSIF